MDKHGKFFGDSYRDWLHIVLLSVLVSAVLAALGALTYRSVNEDIVAGQSQSNVNVSSSVDTRALDAVVKGFDGRNGERSSIMEGYSGVGDPSI